MTSKYDRIADVYDGLFNDVNSILENHFVTSIIPKCGKVLDIGCGTGILLDYLDISPDRYTGIDPSRKMLIWFKEKHPHHLTLHTEFEIFGGGKFDTILSLFGSPSYINPGALPRISEMLNPGGKYFLMFYRPDYIPVTYRKTGVYVEHFEFDSRSFPEADIKLYHNFLLVTNEDLHKPECL
jgi:SAM-dependent methyltransferase